MMTFRRAAELARAIESDIASFRAVALKAGLDAN
jgi:hypothetical protein